MILLFKRKRAYNIDTSEDKFIARIEKLINPIDKKTIQIREKPYRGTIDKVSKVIYMSLVYLEVF